ncbi:MAG: hypothetical protein IT267_08310 [Saprospiraceae bacterium]|nr:hypothetical protein [Saprospiraceae bacterium]
MLLLRLLFIVCLTTYLNAQVNFKFVCPGNITINCNTDISNLDLFGKAYVDQNGTKVWIKDCKVLVELNDCGVGTITRTWGVQDPDFQWQTCTQIITLDNTNAFGYKDITWPRDLTIESCDPEAELKNLLKPFDRPYWKTNKCAKPMLGFTDSRHKVTEGCEKLLRTWRILDWCVYDAYKNPNAGIFTYVQTIKLIKLDTAARLFCPNDTVVSTYQCDSVYLHIDPARLFSPCNMPYSIHNNSIYADTNLNSANGYYPIGDHKVHYIAEYACGEELKCEMNIKVQNIKQPTPYCLDGVIIDLMPIDNNGDGVPDEGMVEVWAKDLDKASFHSCKGRNLEFSFSSDRQEKSKIFTCKELGDNEVTIYVTDNLGNQDYCKTKIVIQNNVGIPNCSKNIIKKKYSYSLTIKNWEQNQLIVKTSVSVYNLHDSSTIQLQENTAGYYSSDKLICNEVYMPVFLVKNKFEVQMEDVLWLKRFLNHQIKNPSTYQILAADVNSDQLIDSTDLNLLIQSKRNKQSMGYKIVNFDLQHIDREKVLEEFASQKLEFQYSDENEYRINYTLIPLGKFNSIPYQEGFSEVNDPTNDDQSLQAFSLNQIGTELFVRSNRNTQMEIRIVDLMGRVIRNYKLQAMDKIQLDLSGVFVQSGIYIVDNGSEKQKFFYSKN